MAERASSRKRRPSETRSASAKYCPNVPSRTATVGSGRRAQASAAHMSFSSSRRRSQRSHSGPRSSTLASPASAEVFGVHAAGGGEPAALGETLEHVLADRVEHVVTAAPPVNEADTIDLSTSAATRYATVASLRPCLAARRRATAGTRRRGERPAAGAASSRPCRGRSSIRRALAARCRPGPRRGVTQERRAARGWRRAPRPSTFTRAAASSIASGNPSTRRAISAASATASASGSNRVVPRARSRKSSTAAASSGATGSLTSLATWSASRLVARIRAWGHSARTVDAIRAASSSTCSHASRTRRAAAGAAVKSRARADRSRERRRRVRGGGRRRPRRPPAEVDEPDAVRELGLEGTRGLDGEPALPTPGAPVSVTRRCSCRAPATWASSSSRPTNEVDGGEIAAAPAADGDGGDRGVVREDRLLEPPELGPGSSPSSSASTRRTSWNVSSASAWRPLR